MDASSKAVGSGGPAWVQSLAGIWQARLDTDNGAVSADRAPLAGPFEHRIFLPATTDQAGLGMPGPSTHLVSLTRKHAFLGQAWFRRVFEVGCAWMDHRVELELERVIWKSQVWIDGHWIGSCESLSTAHVFELGVLSPGSHEIVICVDNRPLHNLGRTHAYIEETQTIWNGIAGRIELRATPRVWIQSIRVELDPAKAGAHVCLGNVSGKAGSGRLIGKLTGLDLSEEISAPVAWQAAGTTVGLKFCSSNLPLWSEFAANLCRLELVLETDSGWTHSREVVFGFRQIAAVGPSLQLNGVPLFLRGEHDGASFPLSGHPPMDVDQWERVFRILKQWGLNHLRFHSYCPPEACFAAADREGIYLQAELPLWVGGLGAPGDESRMDWLRAEAARIFDDYGNHPSLVLFSLGNELEGTYLFQQQLVREFKARDSRCLYTTCSNRLWVADALEKSGRADRPPETDDSNFRRSHQQVRIFQKARAVWNQPGDLGRLSLGIRQSGQGRLHLH